MDPVLRLYEDVLSSDAAVATLPALPRMIFVAHGSVTLAEAQREIATDWRAAYKEWLDPKGCE